MNLEPNVESRPPMNVIEVYPAVEGEGVMAGTPEVILRLAGCNLTCSYCDSEHAWKKGVLNPAAVQRFLSGSDVADEVDRVARGTGRKIEWVSLTGGEPLARDPVSLQDLGIGLRRLGYRIAVQTNGTVHRPSLFPYVDFWSITPTLGGSGCAVVDNPEGMRALETLLAQVRRSVRSSAEPPGQVKFVICNETDIEEADALVSRWATSLDGTIPIIVQPAWQRDEAGAWDSVEVMQQAFQFLLANHTVLSWPGVRVMSQAHKWAYGPERQGV